MPQIMQGGAGPGIVGGIQRGVETLMAYNLKKADLLLEREDLDMKRKNFDLESKISKAKLEQMKLDNRISNVYVDRLSKYLKNQQTAEKSILENASIASDQGIEETNNAMKTLVSGMGTFYPMPSYPQEQAQPTQTGFLPTEMTQQDVRGGVDYNNLEEQQWLNETARMAGKKTPFNESEIKNQRKIADQQAVIKGNMTLDEYGSLYGLIAQENIRKIKEKDIGMDESWLLDL